MTSKAFLKSADLKRMALAAKEHDVCIEVEVNGTIVRVMPSGKHRLLKREMTREEQAEEALASWKSRRDDRPLPDDFAL